MDAVPDPTRRFSDRVDHYVRYRPSYPAGIVDALVSAGALKSTDTLADIGCGTGKLADLFCARGFRVVGVEPNGPMREAGATLLAGHGERFQAVDGRAEATGLDDGSVDLIVAGQAFHWFDAPAARREFMRILRGGRVALVWNDRRASTPFLAAYEALIREHATDYERVDPRKTGDDAVAAFYGPRRFRRTDLEYEQVLDLDGLRGRLLSCSYIPAEGQPGHEETMAALDRLFVEHARDGRVSLLYDTRLYHGTLERTDA